MIKKEIIITIFMIVFLFSFKNIFCLGVSPAKIVLDFEPGFERTFLYKVSGISEKKTIKVSAHGDLAEYVKLSKTTFKGPNIFHVDLKLPYYIETPGKHRIWIRVEEATDDEEVEMIGTTVTINVAIDIFIPYPGKYLEIQEFKTRDVNIGEDVNFEMTLINRGEQTLIFSPEIIINDIHGNLIDKLYLSERTLEPTKGISLKKSFETLDINPGSYNATLFIDYNGDFPAKRTIPFRVGTLIIYLRDYTEEILIGGLKRFDLEIESGWNNNIDGAYADVALYNSSGKIFEFKTSTTPLVAWEKRNITGYIETDNFKPGIYDAEVTLFYYGKDAGKSSVENIKVLFIEKKSYTVIIVTLVVLIVLLSIIILTLFLSRYLKNVKKK